MMAQDEDKPFACLDDESRSELEQWLEEVDREFRHRTPAAKRQENSEQVLDRRPS